MSLNNSPTDARLSLLQEWLPTLTATPTLVKTLRPASADAARRRAAVRPCRRGVRQNRRVGADGAGAGCRTRLFAAVRSRLNHLSEPAQQRHRAQALYRRH